MKASSYDIAILEVLLERLTKQRLPHAQALFKKAKSGQQLNDFDLKFLSNAMSDLQKAQPIYAKYPEYREICTKMTMLYVQIVEYAVKNSQPNP